MKIGVVGTGYVGLVTGAGFAELGNDVMCMDIDEQKIRQLQEGKLPIFEPGLDAIVSRNVSAGRLRFTTSLRETVEFARYIFLTLPTPPKSDGSADVSAVLETASRIAAFATKDTLVITKSTVPVGTTEKVQQILDTHKSSTSLRLEAVSNPEFLREGRAVEDFFRPDRIVIGVNSGWAKEQMQRLYTPFIRQGTPVLFMDIRSSELTKYAANAFLAVRISFINEVAYLCEKLGADVMQVRHGIGLDPRIGLNYLYPSLGYGGSCLPKDVSAIIKTAEQASASLHVIPAAKRVNELQRRRFFEKIQAFYGGRLEGKVFAVWGISFKQNTDDIRDSPALEIIDNLLKAKATVRAYDPAAMPKARQIYGNKVRFGGDMYEVLEGASALVICTEWRPFREPDFNKMKKLLAEPTIFDGRNLYSPDQMHRLGFNYISIGRKPIVQS